MPSGVAVPAALGASEAVPPPKTGEEANLALQLVLRTSHERRYMHLFVGKQLNTISQALQIVALLGATAAYLCLCDRRSAT